ncbi:hypothetical protein LWI28_003875 [Acer negundo]|uniref:Tetrapyrrole biosynthesis glutamyl-tRNA reductase dimerisation domain-containing protein n=1 Tax=Acer negundo TaxID=4023 RepID=A0AAD5NS26_ACENE|nr:hypothetical protein LWI28_003875 [Acer negundo]KAK4847442.1 hypothetical protein QYF36_001963 [Acer negundo]
MVVLHLPSSIKLPTNNPTVSCRVHMSSLFAVATFPTANATYQTKQSRPIEIISLRTRPNKLVINPEVKEYDNGNTTVEEGFGNDDADTIIQRLQTAVETIIDSELKKFTSRVDKELSFEDRRMLMEEMSREIVGKFWEKPIKYLDCADGNLEQKLKHLRFLVRMLEQSCTNDQRSS